MLRFRFVSPLGLPGSYSFAAPVWCAPVLKRRLRNVLRLFLLFWLSQKLLRSLWECRAVSKTLRSNVERDEIYAPSPVRAILV